MAKANGYIIHETATVVLIATGFAAKSKNLKTGAMIQITAVRKDRHPTEAVKDGSDKAICFKCPFRPSLNNETKCYVKTVHGPAKIWKKYSGVYGEGYHKLTDYSLFDGRAVRFGTYGEPVLLPLGVIKEIASRASLWTGYTHQWRNPMFQGYKKYIMASCDEADYQKANALGWRAFIVTKGAKRMPNSATCPASKEMGKRVNCIDCGACSGIDGRGKRNINIAQHK